MWLYANLYKFGEGKMSKKDYLEEAEQALEHITFPSSLIADSIIALALPDIAKTLREIRRWLRGEVEDE